MANEKNNLDALKSTMRVDRQNVAAKSGFQTDILEQKRRFIPKNVRDILLKIYQKYTSQISRSKDKLLVERIEEEIAFREKEAIRTGVDFTRCQLDEIIHKYNAGVPIEVESFSPYLSDYNMVTGEIWEDTLQPADEIGLEIAKLMKERFPKAKVISLYDEYNSGIPDSTDVFGKPTAKVQVNGGIFLDVQQQEFSEEVKKGFRRSIEMLLRKKDVIKKNDSEGRDFLFVSESEKVRDAERLVVLLEEHGKKSGVEYIQRNGNEIYFQNIAAENPLYKKILLRTKNGRWLCEALDASSFLDSKNLAITHLVILPSHFKKQQDKVWEILRVLGIQPTNYHNIFFDETKPASEVVKVIDDAFQLAAKKAA